MQQVVRLKDKCMCYACIKLYVLNIVQDDEISIAYEQFGCIIIHVCITQLPCSNETQQTTPVMILQMNILCLK